MNRRSKLNLRILCVTAILGVIGFILMLLEIALPFMPGFIKLDFSELPALIASFSFGPLSGIGVCFIKNLLHLPMSGTSGIGELSNFILGAIFVGIAGWIYKINKTRKGALLACVLAALAMAVASVPSNYFITYPLFGQVMGMPSAAILGMYKAINSNMDNLWECLVLFNLPFCFAKGLINSVLCFVIYKKLSPLIKGKFS